jgi:hypothetical protein
LGITYGNDLYVSVGVDGLVLTSEDGIIWTERPTGSTAALQKVTYGNGKFVAVGTNGTILTSTDGISWSAATSGVSVWLADVTYGNGKFIIVGYDATILSSNDGVLWSKVNIGYHMNLYDIVYQNDKYFITGTGSIFTSATGTTWTRTATPVDFDGVIYGNNTYVATSSGYWNKSYTSPDGINWSDGTSLPSTTIITGLQYANGLFIAYGEGGKILTSSDGVVWSDIASVMYEYSYLFDMVVNNGTLFVVGDGGAILQASIAPEGDVTIDNFIDKYTVNPGDTFNPTGIINSPYKITKVSLSVVDWLGVDIYGQHDGVYLTTANESNTFDLSSFNINTFDPALTFKGSEDYYINIWIKEEGQEAKNVGRFLIVIDGVINFQDLHFEQAVRDKLNMPTGDIFKSDVETIYRLNIDYDDYIKNLYGIQYFTNLKSLDMPNLQIDNYEDFTANFYYFTGLTKLEELGMYGCNLQNIEWISSLNNLESLNLGDNRISDLTPISQLKNLKYLDISYNNISNLEPLIGLNNLMELDIEGNPISDYTSLVSLYYQLFTDNIFITFPDLQFDQRFLDIPVVSATDIITITTSEEVSYNEVKNHVFVALINQEQNCVDKLMENNILVHDNKIIISPPEGGYPKGIYCLYLSQYLKSNYNNSINQPIKYIFEVK